MRSLDEDPSTAEGMEGTIRWGADSEGLVDTPALLRLPVLCRVVSCCVLRTPHQPCGPTTTQHCPVQRPLKALYKLVFLPDLPTLHSAQILPTSYTASNLCSSPDTLRSSSPSHCNSRPFANFLAQSAASVVLVARSVFAIRSISSFASNWCLLVASFVLQFVDLLRGCLGVI